MASAHNTGMHYIKPLLLCGILLFSSVYLNAQTLSPQIRLKKAVITIAANSQTWYNNTVSEIKQATQKQVLIHLQHLPNQAERQALSNAGIIIGDYVDRTTYTALVTLHPLQFISLPTILYGITPVQANWKTDMAFSNQKEQVRILVSFFENIDANEIAAMVQSNAGIIEKSALETAGFYKITIPANRVPSLRNHYAVKSIAVITENQTLNYESKTASKSNTATLASVYGGYGLSGKGVTLGIGDNVSGNSHIDLKDRTVNFNPQAYTNHGVHINGIAGGAGIADKKAEGVAHEANLVNHLFNLVWENTASFFQLYNMTITNNSYAAVIKDCNYAGTYNTYAAAIDKLALQYNEVLHVFAAGNDGNMTCNPYPQGYATVVGAYQAAKNNIVVTSTDKRYVNAKDGGRGPIKDGRLKPEITAVGVDVRSTTQVDSYLVSGGTSMASPGVAGGLALLTERYKQLNSNKNPRADLLKTLLLNAATDIGNPGPDYCFGFGFMNLTRSLKMMDANNYFTSKLSNATQQTFNITVPPNTAQLKVMLCWFDAAASILSTKQLVNDLDIEISTPTAAIHKPLILDATPANILNNAVEGVDRLNNTEQIVINNPQAGNYTITVKGFNVPSAEQDFVLAYDAVPQGVLLTFPTRGAQVAANDSLRIYWDASDNNNTLKLEYTINGGSVWNVIDNNIPSEQRYYTWFVPQNISSGKCLLRVSRNNTGEQHTTGLFAINPIPSVTLDATQCPGYIRINWNAIPNATGYEVMKKEGAQMRVLDTVNAISYTFNGLATDSMYYVAVRPIVDGLSGYRSLAVKRLPNDGTCAGNISDGDLRVQELIKPQTGRKLTSTELTTNEQITVAIRNLDDVAVNSYKVWYKINNGTWQSQSFTNPIPANSISNINFTTSDFSVLGTYNISIAVQNMDVSDPVAKNDSLFKQIRQLDNKPVSLVSTMLNDFEDWPVIETLDAITGISPDERWDYTNANDTCRLRSFVRNDITVKGNRSVSLDAIINTDNNHQNDFWGTFNLATYNASIEEVRLEFDYLLHGYASDSETNAVYIRGSDTQPWKLLYPYNLKNAGSGKVANSGSLSVTDVLLNAAQNFSSSFQIKFAQNDMSLISERAFGRGISIDDVKLYTVQNDAQMVQVVSPIISECGLTGMQPLTVKIRNGVNQTLNNIQLYYQYDNKAVVNETLATIGGKQTVNYTFNNKIDLTQRGKHTISVWLIANGDTYVLNDSILKYEFYNQPLVVSYPYLEDFENGDGNWYTNGQKSSWAYGTPASPLINKARSGTKAWKTNLTGIYNPSELSYLYSPCFDISALKNPYYRFKLALDIENCGQVFCDGANMEYSSDGLTWQKLGKWNEGKGWYNDSIHNVWSIENSINWQEASIALPKGLSFLRLRYRFSSDLGAEKEGMAIDDAEIYDDLSFVVENNLMNVTPNPTRDGKIYFDWTARGGTKLEMTMYSTMGKQVYQANATASGGRNKTMMQTPVFQSGVYIMRIIIGDRKYSRKIVYL